MIDSLLAGFISVLVTWAQPYVNTRAHAVSTAEINCIAETIYFESRGEGSEGMVSIAYVVLNRTITHNKTICAVVHEPSQFSYYNPHHQKPIREPDLWIQSIAIGVFAQLGVIKNPIGNATMFNTTLMDSWVRHDHMVMTKKINNHYFYTEKDYVRADPLVPAKDRFASKLTNINNLSRINMSTFDLEHPVQSSNRVDPAPSKSVLSSVYDKYHRHRFEHRSYTNVTKGLSSKPARNLERTACSHC